MDFQTLFAFGGWLMSVMTLAGAATHAYFVEVHNAKLSNYAASENRRADFWRRVALDCQSERAELHKKTVTFRMH